jgi:hypothetical protein
MNLLFARELNGFTTGDTEEDLEDHREIVLTYNPSFMKRTTLVTWRGYCRVQCGMKSKRGGCEGRPTFLNYVL